MYCVVETAPFSAWICGLRDTPTRIRLLRRIGKVQRGLLGDHKALGHGVWELREDFGPGWRMYYTMQNSTIILMLGGGEKSSQTRDIEQARILAQEFNNAHAQNPPV